MSQLGLSTIAQLLYLNEQSIDFARTVAELEGALSRLQPHQVQIAWDCDDFVCFDIPGTRIQLAWSEVDMRGYKACLSVSVGPGGDLARGFHEDMCSRLVDRIKSRFDPVAVLWCQTEGAIGSDVIDDLLTTLPHLNRVLPDIETVLAALSQQEARLSAQAAPTLKPRFDPRANALRPTSRKAPLRVAANDHPDWLAPDDQALANVRRALHPYLAKQATYSVQMRLAVHSLNATLILVWTPLGAALMTYSILRGENMRLSSRVMAVTGTFLALAQSGVGATVAAMARAIG